MDSSQPKIADLIQAQNERLIELVMAVQNNQELLSACIAAIVGAFAAYSFNWLHWRQVRKQELLSDASKSLISLINELEKVSVDYWLRNSDSEKDKAAEARLISINSNIRAHMERLKISQKNAKRESSCLDSFASEIYDITTGGQFESANRKASKGTVQKIVRKCGNAKAYLYSII